MKKIHIIALVLAVLVLIAGAAAFFLTGNAVEDAEAAHKAVLAQYNAAKTNAANTTLTVHEDGIVVGSYTMEELGLLPGLYDAIDGCYSATDRLPAAEFAQMDTSLKLQWSKEAHPKNPAVSADLQQLDLAPVFADLEAQPRKAAQNAYVDFVDDAFLLHDEVPGTELEPKAIAEALTETLSGVSISASSTSDVRFELTDTDCYLLPEITVANQLFDFNAMLLDSIQDMEVTVDFHGKTETLDAQDLEQLLYADDAGKVQINTENLEPLVNRWWSEHQESDVPFLFDSYVDGVIPIDFLHVDYEINPEELTEQLSEQLVQLESFELEAPWYCWRNAEPFSIEGEYIEIDINNQTMTYFKDDEVVVTTPVVTGATWGYPTPEGLYDIDNKDTDCWLKGDDYNVHVDYWMGFVGIYIGIHDADWRTKFGGDNYVKNGSHGCVNTPKEATKIIFENADLGVPVLVHGK